MYCRKCGNQLDDDSKFCDKCGTKVELLEEDNVASRATRDVKEDSDAKRISQEEKTIEDEGIETILDLEEPFVVKDIKKVADKKTQVCNGVILTMLVIVLMLEILAYIPINNRKKLSIAYEMCVQNQIEEKPLFDELWADIQEDTDKKAVFIKAIRVRAEQIYLNTEEDVVNRLQQLQDLQTWGVVDTTYFQEQLQAEIFCNHLVNDSSDVVIASLIGVSESLLNRYMVCSFQKGEDMYQQYLQETITYEAFLAYIQNLQACNILNYPIVDWSERLSAVSTNRTAFLQAEEQYNQKNYYEAFVLLNGLSLHQDDTVYNEKIETLKASIVAEAKAHYLEMANSYLANGDKKSSAKIYKDLKGIYGNEDADVKTIVGSLVEDWKVAYLEKLRELANTEETTMGGTGCYTRFFLKKLFLDGDEIPELLVFAPLENWGKIRIYTYEDGIKEVTLDGLNQYVADVYYWAETTGGLIIVGGQDCEEYSCFSVDDTGKHRFNSGASGYLNRDNYDEYKAMTSIIGQSEHINFHDMKENNYKKYLKLGDLDL